MTKYTKNLSEPWFSLIKLGIKKCEGRLKKGDFNEIKKGDFNEIKKGDFNEIKKGDNIIFENNDFGFLRNFTVKITAIHNYKSFTPLKI